MSKPITINKLFVYDDLLTEESRKILLQHVNPISEQIAIAEGKLYKVGKDIVYLHTNDYGRNKGSRTIYGAILEFNPADMRYVLDTIANYKGCSQHRTYGAIRTSDLTYPQLITVYPITFSSIHDLKRYRYKRKRGENCIVYAGNPNHETIYYHVKINRHHKLINGFYAKGFIDLLNRRGYTIE